MVTLANKVILVELVLMVKQVRRVQLVKLVSWGLQVNREKRVSLVTVVIMVFPGNVVNEVIPVLREVLVIKVDLVQPESRVLKVVQVLLEMMDTLATQASKVSLETRVPKDYQTLGSKVLKALKVLLDLKVRLA